MNILVDSCAYTCQNVGDMAMLSVAVSRLRELWPEATIQVITDAPDRVAALCGNVQPVPVRGRRLVLDHRLLGRVDRLLPARLARRWTATEQQVKGRHLSAWGLAQQVKLALRGKDADEVRTFVSAIRRANLVVVSGAGVLTDEFEENALGILATLEMAQRRKTPTALFGQGVGPMTTDVLRSRAKAVLPGASLIGVRERRASLALLPSLGVSLERVMVTGDDALDLVRQVAREMGPPGPQAAIGVNIRVAPYSNVTDTHLTTVRTALAAASSAHVAKLIPVPIAHRNQMDVKAIRDLLGHLCIERGEGAVTPSTPRDVIATIRECRLVVTGSYHGAVFALGQGIPAVAIASSQYYIDKMTGLADQFGDGCYVVRLDRPGAATQLVETIAQAWRQAERHRPALLRRAEDQVHKARAAYDRLKANVGGYGAGTFAPRGSQAALVARRF